MIFLLLSVLFTGCAFQSVAKTPEDASRNLDQYKYANLAGNVNQYQLLGKRAWSDGEIVVYRSVRLIEAHKTEEVLGYSIVVPRDGGWKTIEHIEEPMNEFLVRPGLMGSDTSMVDLGQQNLTTFVGIVHEKRIKIVEVTLSSGMVLRDMNSDGIYAFVVKNGGGICRRKYIGENDRVIEDIRMDWPTCRAMAP